jgi:exodeoxyribonuclease III
MPFDLSIATWNINSVRLRQEQVLRFLAEQKPDILCLQETKCPDPLFPAAAFTKAGYAHQAIAGIKGYNGVAVLSRLPLDNVQRYEMCGKPDARHISVTLGGAARGITVHNFYVPAGGDIANPDENPKFAHKLAFVDELLRFSAQNRASNGRMVLVGDLNIAPFEHDVWSHKQLLDVVSHTPIETEALKAVIAAGEWGDAMRHMRPEPSKLYSWWSYRSPDWDKADKGRRLDHIWLGRELMPALTGMEIFRQTRGWERPSDHVPVMVRLQMQ